MKKTDEKLVNKMRRLRAQGKTTREIAQATGVNPSTVSRRLADAPEAPAPETELSMDSKVALTPQDMMREYGLDPTRWVAGATIDPWPAILRGLASLGFYLCLALGVQALPVRASRAAQS